MRPQPPQVVLAAEMDAAGGRRLQAEGDGGKLSTMAMTA